MNAEHREQYSTETLEELAMHGDADAAQELRRRYAAGGEPADPAAPAVPSAAPAAAVTPAQKIEAWSADFRATQYRRRSLYDLNTAAQAGDPFAAYALAAKYLQSKNDREQQQGAEYLVRARALLAEAMMNNVSPAVVKPFLVQVLLTQGQLYEKNGQPDKAFLCYQDAHETDPRQAKDLIRCLEQGLGTKPDPERAFTLREQAARSGGAAARVDMALYTLQRGQTLTAAQWLQLALNAADIGRQPAQRAAARYLLCRLGESDERGAEIDLAAAEQELEAYADTPVYAAVTAGRPTARQQQEAEARKAAEQAAAEEAARKAAEQAAAEEAARKAAAEEAARLAAAKAAAEEVIRRAAAEEEARKAAEQAAAEATARRAAAEEAARKAAERAAAKEAARKAAEEAARRAAEQAAAGEAVRKAAEAEAQEAFKTAARQAWEAKEARQNRQAAACFAAANFLLAAVIALLVWACAQGHVMPPSPEVIRGTGNELGFTFGANAAVIIALVVYRRTNRRYCQGSRFYWYSWLLSAFAGTAILAFLPNDLGLPLVGCYYITNLISLIHEVRWQTDWIWKQFEIDESTRNLRRNAIRLLAGYLPLLLYLPLARSVLSAVRFLVGSTFDAIVLVVVIVGIGIKRSRRKK